MGRKLDGVLRTGSTRARTARIESSGEFLCDQCGKNVGGRCAYRARQGPLTGHPFSHAVRVLKTPNSGPADRNKSGPIGEDGSSLDDLFRIADEVELLLPCPACHFDLDGIQAGIFHFEAELLLNFRDPVLLEAIAHGPHSGR